MSWALSIGQRSAVSGQRSAVSGQFWVVILSLSILFLSLQRTFADVNPDGSFSHLIPVKVPTGTKNIAPNLSLVYNSNSGNGMLGTGWSLSGLSYITRINYGNGIKYNGSDTYMSSNHGVLVDMGDGTYHSKNESFTKFEKIGVCEYGPCQWFAADKSGTKYYYGASNDSRIEKTGDSSVRVWALSKVEDLAGNYYEINYLKEAGKGGYYPSLITYTKNAGISRYRTVEFEYESRQDHHPVYNQNSYMNLDKRLNRIIIRSDGQLLRKYQLGYEYSPYTNQSRLISLQEFGNDGTSALPAQNFTYANGQNGWSESGYGLPSQIYFHFTDGRDKTEGILQDINGDGIADYTKATCWESGGCDLTVHHGTGSGFVNAGYSLPGAIFYHYTDGRVKTQGVLQDINGDGKADFSKATAWEGGAIEKSVYHGIGNGFVDAGYELPSQIYYHYADGRVKTEGILQDINGDGLADFCKATAWEGGAVDKTVYHGTGNGFVNAGYELPSQIYYHYADGRVKTEGILQDINGDGKADFTKATAWEGGAIDKTVYHGTGNSFVNAGYELPSQIYYHYADGRVKTEGILQDINGDGLADFSKATAWDGGSPAPDLKVFFGTGNGFSDAGYNLPSQIFYHYADGKVKVEGILQDINGDGLADFSKATAWEGGSPTPDLTVYHGTGNDFVNAGYSLPSQIFYHFTDGKMKTEGVLQDINGDGKADFCKATAWEGGTPSSDLTVHHGNNPKTDLLVSVTNGYGAVTSVTYDLSTYISGVSHPSQSVYPVIANSSLRYLVTQTAVQDGRGAVYSTNYEYYNGKFYIGAVSEAADLGFEWTKEINNQTGAYEITYYRQDKPYHGAVREKRTYANGNLLMKLDSFNYSVVYPYNGTQYIRPVSIVNSTYEMGNFVFNKTQEFTEYDNYGNATKILDKAENTDTIEINLSYSADAANWVLNRLTESKKISNGKTIEWQQFVYNGNDLAEKKDYLDTDGSWISVKFKYDNIGNVSGIEDALGNTTVLSYDSKFKSFVTGSANPLGHTISKAYDVNGNAVSTTDANGNMENREYDVFGRLTRIIEPGDDWTKEYIYANAGDPNNQYTEIRLRDNSTDGFQWSRTFVDGLGRKYKTVSEWDKKTDSSLLLIKEYEYDSAGRLSRESTDYVLNYDEIFYTTYQYDSVGRATRKIFPDNTEFSIAYNGLNIVKTDQNGKSATEIYNARGQLAQKIEANSASISYSYNTSGKLIQVIDAGGKTTSISYDSLGRKISMTDPNTGTRNYVYDALSRLTRQTDANNNTLVFEYDKIGRMVLEDFPAGQTDIKYKYDDPLVANAIGRMTEVENESGKESFSYDLKGNIKNWIKAIDGFNFAFAMTYDPQRRLESLDYPDGTGSRNLYSDAGFLKQVKMAKKGEGGHPVALYKRPSSNYEIVRQTGNGIKTTTEYNPRNSRPIRVQSVFQGTTLEDLSYTFDNTGNVTELKDNLDPAFTQNFGYDNLYRLVSARGVYGNLAYGYDNAGNLVAKGNVSLNYADSLHPYAVTSDSLGNAYQYDVNGNMIQRKGEILTYDARDRLVSLKNDGSLDEKYIYDHKGLRVKKSRKDGAVVYNIGGIYEMTLAPNRETHLTTYIFGLKGDLIAQSTIKADPGLALNFLSPVHQKALASLYSPGSVQGIILKIYHGLNSIVIGNDLYWRILKGLFIAFSISVFIIYILNKWSPYFWTRGRQAKRGFSPSMELNHLALVIFFGAFVIFGASCGRPEGKDAPNGNPPWSGLNENPIDGNTPDLSDGTREFQGFPVTGVYFFHSNHQRSVSFVTDAQGTVISRARYKPYGEILREHSSGPDIFRYKYTGQEEDANTGLLYYKARFYDPAIGRFITPDSLIPDSMNSQAYNRYMYVYGNPARYLDPSGKSIIDDISGSVGDFFDGVTGGISDAWNNVTNWFKENVSWSKISSGITDAANAVVNYNFRANVVIPALTIMSKVIRGTIYGVAGAALGIISGAVYGFLLGGGGSPAILIGAIIGGVTGLIGGFMGGYNDIYSHDWRGLVAFASDYTWSLPNTFLGLGYMAYAYSRGGRLSGHSRQSNAFVIMGNSNIVPGGKSGFTIGNVFGINTSVSNPALEKELFQHELIHVWQYRGFGPTFLPLYGIDAIAHSGYGRDMWFEKPAYDYENDNYNTLTAGTY